MVKVTNPLGSDEAHGQLMKAVIFQGRTAKQYRAPSRTRTAAVVAQETFFKQYTQMIATAKIWPRKAWRNVLGSNWFGLLFEWISDNYTTFAQYWAVVSEHDRALWQDAAPGTAAGDKAGEVFFICALGAYLNFSDKQSGYFGMPEPLTENLSELVAWWLQDLNQVFLPGVYDDDHGDIEYSEGDWATVGGQVYYGGYAHLSQSGGNPYYAFWFLGSWLSIWYKQSPTYAGMQITIDNYAPIIVSQNGESVPGLVKYTTPKMEYGLHRVKVKRDGQSGGIIFDKFEVTE